MTAGPVALPIRTSIRSLDLGLCEVHTYDRTLQFRNLRHLNLGCINLPSLNDYLEKASVTLVHLETLRISGQILRDNLEPIGMILTRLQRLTLLDLTHVDVYLPCSSPKRHFPWDAVVKAKRLRNLILVGAFQALPLMIPASIYNLRPDLNILSSRLRFDLDELSYAQKNHLFDINALIAPNLFSDHTLLGRALGTTQSDSIIRGLLELGAEPNCNDPIRLLGNTRPELISLFLKHGSHIETFYQARLEKWRYESLLETVPLRFSQWEKLILGKYLEPRILEFLLTQIPTRYLERLKPALQSAFLEEVKKNYSSCLPKENSSLAQIRGGHKLQRSINRIQCAGNSPRKFRIRGF